MKILAIRGENMASLEAPFEIDFTTEPLCSAGIFAITGSTGSGKSSILDTLCLALYDKTPRMELARERVNLSDVGENIVAQGDCRNILRRGAGNGYAEVDFLSLSGERYRSRWSVKRAYDRPEGALQPQTIRLTNLTTHREEQGTKSVLLARIQELTGLTFDQFTRSVLLAQGDFATFLKSDQSRKADLLEKLTGTEIYSRISVRIYQKAKEADEEVNRIRREMESIETLSAETLVETEREREENQRTIAALDQQTQLLNRKLDWLKREAEWQRKVTDAERESAVAERAVTAAAPRRSYLEGCDRAQEIRDDFRRWMIAAKQLKERQKGITEERDSLKNHLRLLDELQATIDAGETKLKESTAAFEQAKPQIAEARKLDVEIGNARKYADEAEASFQTAQDKQRQAERSLENTKQQCETTERSVAAQQQWLSDNHHYGAIVPEVVSLMKDIARVRDGREQEWKHRSILDREREIAAGEVKEREHLLREQERLNRMLPGEIALLRAALREGTPCPVCGSIHHPYQGNMQEATLKEQQLEKEKKRVAERLLQLETQLGDRRAQIIRLESSVRQYAGQVGTAVDELERVLSDLPGWRQRLDEGVLESLLRKKTKEWQACEEALRKGSEQLRELRTARQFQEEHLKAVQTTVADTKKRRTEATGTLHELQQRRKAYLDGKAADAAEHAFEREQRELSQQLSDEKERQNRVRIARERSETVIRNIEGETERLSGEVKASGEKVSGWLTDKAMTVDELSQLLSQTPEWVKEERAALDRLERTRTAKAASLEERRQSLEQHRKADDRPAPEEAEADLRSALAEKEQEIRQKTKRNAEITVMQDRHRRNIEKKQSLQRTCDAKAESAENWNKLRLLFGSADGKKFKELAQQYTLDALLVYTNLHLASLTPRYRVERIPETLALQVVDADMMDEVRTVHSLSGGESFLVSLALALGLSSLSSNRMRIESLFIDEGFGSLDTDTLRIAMDTLEGLQTQGRKIGVISHVAEMTERITTQIRVEKGANGKSRMKIAGS